MVDVTERTAGYRVCSSRNYPWTAIICNVTHVPANRSVCKLSVWIAIYVHIADKSSSGGLTSSRRVLSAESGDAGEVPAGWARPRSGLGNWLR